MKKPALNTLTVTVAGGMNERMLLGWTIQGTHTSRTVNAGTKAARFHGLPEGDIVVTARYAHGALWRSAVVEMPREGERSVRLEREASKEPAKIGSSAITVGGKHFVAWFNEDFKKLHRGNHPTIGFGDYPAAKFPHKVLRGSFCTVFDRCADLWQPKLTLEQFLALFGIMYNETGG